MDSNYMMTEIDNVSDEFDEAIDYQVVEPSEIQLRGQLRNSNVNRDGSELYGLHLESMRTTSINNITENDFYNGMMQK